MTVKTRVAALEKRTGGAGCGDSPQVPGVCPRLAPRLIAPGDTYTACERCGRPPFVVVVERPAEVGERGNIASGDMSRSAAAPMFIHEVARGVWKVYGGVNVPELV